MSPVGRRILVVDDNVGAASLCGRLLTALGPHQVELAYDGRSAIERLQTFHPDIVLLDIGLPDVSGYQVAQTIREDRALDAVLLVAVTGYGEEEDRRRAYEVGFDEHVVKPPSVEVFRLLLDHPKLAAAPEESENESQFDQSEVVAGRDGTAFAASQEIPEADKPLTERLGTIVHDLGNVNYVVSLAATILGRSKDGSQVEVVGRMLKELEPQFLSLIDSLRHLRSELREPPDTGN